MHETAPICIDSESDSESDNDDEVETNSDANTTSLYDSEQIMKMNATESLGDWEKYTKVRQFVFVCRSTK